MHRLCYTPYLTCLHCASQPKTSILFQKRHPFTEILNSEMPGDCEITLLHSGDVLVLLQVRKAIAVMGLPANPLDSLIDLLGGPDHVAEMTGRKARLVRQQGGLTGVKWEARNASGVAASATLDLINVHERQMFLNLEKRIAIISEAASAGISLHADRSEQRAAAWAFSICITTCVSQPKLWSSLCASSLETRWHICHWLYKTCHSRPTNRQPEKKSRHPNSHTCNCMPK